MRIISFSVMWPKLKNDVYSTVRYGPSWKTGEQVQVFFKNRSPRNRKKLGEATITAIEDVALEPCGCPVPRIRAWPDCAQDCDDCSNFPCPVASAPRLITDAEAAEDGFALGRAAMVDWLKKKYRAEYRPTIRKLTLKWNWRHSETPHVRFTTWGNGGKSG